MNARILFAIVCLSFVFVLSALAEDQWQITRDNTVLHSGGSLQKSAVDTVTVMGPTGSGAAYIGDFETGWNGWTSVDYTASTVSHWNVSNYNQVDPLDFAMWCGDAAFVSCGGTDVDGGYGNDWHDLVAYRRAVTNSALGATVTVTADLQYDTESGYDYTTLGQKIAGNFGFTEVGSWSSLGTELVNISFDYLPAEYIDGTDIYVVWQVKSDGGWSDSDCSWPSAGACQVDDVTVEIVQVGEALLTAFDDFQIDFGNWFTVFPAAVGDFAARWSGLEDADVCITNYSQQVAFIDDGLVVPGTGGSDCLDWCYGPGGYIVSPAGGLAGPEDGLHNAILSPVMHWPDATYDGIIVAFEVYVHENLAADSPGIFYYWGIRSADTDDSAGNGPQVLADQTSMSRNFIYFGGPEYTRITNQLTDLMNPGRDEIQLELAVLDHSGFSGNNGSPAPYFDNVSIKVFPFDGPALTARLEDLAQDTFPESDVLDYNNLGSMNVRFDAAQNISFRIELNLDPGDSVVVDIVPVRTGSTLFGTPSMVYTIKANPLFDPYRTVATSGSVSGVVAVGRNGYPDPDAWAFDLPDTGTLFPGDILHYYFSASDDVGGDVRTATLPADITGFGDFSGPLAYDTDFVVHALPTIESDGFGGYSSPKILFWDDAGNSEVASKWYDALEDVSVRLGIDCDVYHTNAPGRGVGNGLGSRTGGAALAIYDYILHTAGDLVVNTLTNGDFARDGSDDVGALMAWLSLGNKGLFLTGDNLASDLAYNVGVSGMEFAETVMGVNVVDKSIRSLIGNQVTPLVVPIYDNPVLYLNEWIAYGGCLNLNTFDALTVRAGAERLAEYLDPSGTPAYPYSAATANTFANSSEIVSLPYDLSSVVSSSGSQIGNYYNSARSIVLAEVLAYLGYNGWVDCITRSCSGVPEAEVFGVKSYPNPFNPQIRLDYTIKAAGHLSLKVFDVRGHLVRTLVDERVQTNGFVMWDGTDSNGSRVASGVYFREARMGDEVLVEKMALIK